MKKAIAVVLAVGVLAAPAYAALTGYVGRGTHDTKMRVLFKKSSTKVRAFEVKNALYECNVANNFRSGFSLPPMVIRADNTFVFSDTADFGDHTGTVYVRGRILRGGNVVGFIKERRRFDDGDVCRTGREPYRAHPRRR